MAYTAPPAKAEISATPSPSNAAAKAGMGKFIDAFLGLFGSTGEPYEVYQGIKLVDPNAVYNLELGFAVSTNALTATLRGNGNVALGASNPGFIAQRASTIGGSAINLRKIIANVSLTISSGSTVGHTSTDPGDLFWYLIDNAGAMELAVCGTFQGFSGIFTTTAEGGAGAADLKNVMYSATARTSLPGRLIAITRDTQTVAGTWTAVPTEYRAAPFYVDNEVIMPTGRLTASSGSLPVTSTDITAQASIWYTPYQGNLIQVWDGYGWVRKTFAEISQTLADTTKSPAASVANSNYDLFVWDDAGTMRVTRGPVWTGDNVRGTGAATTELELFEGRLVNKNAITNGPGVRRGVYVGTIRTTAANQVEDSKAKRFVWNNFNRVERPCAAPLETADSWNYQSATIRQANANTANKFETVRGLNEDALRATVIANAVSTGANASARVCVGINTTSANSGYPATMDCSNALGLQGVAVYEDLPGVGYVYASWNEVSQATTAVTFQGDNGGASTTQSGIFGRTLA